MARSTRRVLLLAALLTATLVLSVGCDDEAGSTEQRTPRPYAVSDLQAEASNEQVYLAWVASDSSGVDGTVVFRSEDEDFPFLEDGDTVPLEFDNSIDDDALDHLIYDGDGTAIVDSGLDNNTTYYYAVFAYREPSAYSAGRFTEATPPGANQGTAAAPVTLTTDDFPYTADLGPGGSSFFRVSSLGRGSSRDLSLTGLERDAGLRVFANPDFLDAICTSDSSGLGDEKCEGPTNDGQLWVRVDDNSGLGGSFTLELATGSFGTQSIPYAPEAAPFANALGLGDDQLSGSVPIGFSFEFFGQHFTTLYVSSNGFITFDGGADHGCCEGGELPDGGDAVNNIIALAWDDFNPGVGGTVDWELRGTPPNQRLVVNYDSINWLGFTGQNHLTGQIVLHEADGAIDLHLGHLSARPQGTGRTTQGVEDAQGRVGYYVPGRVAEEWGTDNNSIRIYTQPLPPN